MSLNRWKVLACTLTVGVGGLAVFATDPAPKPEAPKDPLPNLTVKPSSPANGSDTPAPVVSAKGDEFELTVPVPPAPVKAEEPAKKPADGPVFEPVDAPAPLIVPVRGEADPKDSKKGEPAKKDDVPPVAVPPLPEKPPEIKIPTKPPMDLDIPPIVKPSDEPPPAVKAKPIVPSDPVPPPATPVPEVLRTPAVVPGPKPDVPPVILTPTPTNDAVKTSEVKVPLTAGAPKPPEGTKLKMLLRMGDGQPRFEIRNSGTTELLLKVYGEKIEMQAPPDAKSTLAGVTAMGRVRFTAPGIEGTCDHLTILSGTGEVLLKGNIHLKSRHGKTMSEMTAEKMVYQIGTTGLTTSGTPKVTPAAYIPD